jgi:hypothetical protein
VRRVGEGNRNLKKIWLLAGVRLAVPSRMARQRVPAAPHTLAWESWTTPTAYVSTMTRLAAPTPTARQCNLHAPGAVARQDCAAALMFQRFQYRGSDPEARKKWRDNIKLPREAPRRGNVGQTRLFLIHQLKKLPRKINLRHHITRMAKYWDFV